MNNTQFMKWVLELTNQEYAGNLNSCIENINANNEMK